MTDSKEKIHSNIENEKVDETYLAVDNDHPKILSGSHT